MITFMEVRSDFAKICCGMSGLKIFDFSPSTSGKVIWDQLFLFHLGKLTPILTKFSKLWCCLVQNLSSDIFGVHFRSFCDLAFRQKGIWCSTQTYLASKLSGHLWCPDEYLTYIRVIMGPVIYSQPQHYVLGARFCEHCLDALKLDVTASLPNRESDIHPFSICASQYS
jgi:hypothetical protein